ncbi:LysE family translocator [Cryptosporangium aurantiacum]|uniref:Threonine/homoserine/homoserine lactone efflux protein n=1 Tax=Cryptosporangium aurantiacum TaxID=134849 RepID=A0A1M7NQU5_9ACTN|nr:LysE family translocator [Cryptosporangium aurantiacum]SHN06178.1 Threonine/homoserine/homoserine lactone efflux protein [Cryptosporangium aurantiacum]
MLPLSHLVAFTLTALIIIAIPGPSVLFVIGRSLSLGRRGGLMSVAGNTLGMVPQVVAVSLGVGAVVAKSILLFQLLKLAGAAYLVYLGIQAIRHRHAMTNAEPSESQSARRLIWQGFVVGITNPKSIVFFVAVLPQFADPSSGNMPLQLAILGLIVTTIGLVHDSLWAMAAATARRWFARSKDRVARLGATGGVMMIGLGATLALTGAKE